MPSSCAIEAADALRFCPLSDETRHRYYELFRLGHSPSSAFSEYETVLMMQNDTIPPLIKMN